MAFKKLVAPSLTELFIEELKSMILSGKLSIGEKLPPERQMAEEMNVSLAVIHNGIKQLVSLGFLYVVPRQGIFVTDYVRNGNMETMMEIINYHEDRLSDDIMKPIIDFRRSIELASIRLACEHRTEESLTVLSQLADKAAKDGDSSSLPETAFHFHHEIALASGNIYYPMITKTFQPLFLVFYQKRLAVREAASVAAFLQSLYEAIKDRKTDVAEDILNRSIDEWVAALDE